MTVKKSLQVKKYFLDLWTILMLCQAALKHWERGLSTRTSFLFPILFSFWDADRRIMCKIFGFVSFRIPNCAALRGRVYYPGCRFEKYLGHGAKMLLQRSKNRHKFHTGIKYVCESTKIWYLSSKASFSLLKNMKHSEGNYFWAGKHLKYFGNQN